MKAGRVQTGPRIQRGRVGGPRRSHRPPLCQPGRTRRSGGNDRWAPGGPGPCGHTGRRTSTLSWRWDGLLEGGAVKDSRGRAQDTWPWTAPGGALAWPHGPQRIRGMAGRRRPWALRSRFLKFFFLWRNFIGIKYEKLHQPRVCDPIALGQECRLGKTSSQDDQDSISPKGSMSLTHLQPVPESSHLPPVTLA